MIAEGCAEEEASKSIESESRRDKETGGEGNGALTQRQVVPVPF